MRIVYALAAVVALSGCMKQAVKPGVTTEQAMQDQRECQFEATKATAAIVNPFDRGWEKATIERQCLEVRGYRYQ